MNVAYPKKLMTRSELIAFGIPEAVIDRALRSKYQPEFAMKTGKGRTSKWIVDTVNFDWYLQEGVFE